MRFAFLILFSLTSAYAQNVQLEKVTGAVLNNKKIIFGETPQDSLIKPILTKYVVNEAIAVRPIEGHHFNLKANNNCNFQKPNILQKDFIECQFRQPGNEQINLFICDDKETFCKMEKLGVQVTAPQGFSKIHEEKSQQAIFFVPKQGLKAPPGFILNDAKKAQIDAQKNNQLLLISFSAAWCPSCNLLDENVYENKKFQEETKDIVKLMLDVDSDLSWPLKEKYHVAGYPTVVLATSSGNEIGRLTDYRTPQAVSVWLKQMRGEQNEPIDFVMSKVQSMYDSSKNPIFKNEYQKKVLRLAQWYLDQGQPEKAKEVLKKIDVKAGERLNLEANYKIADKKNNKNEIAKSLEELIKKYPQDVYATNWADELSQINLRATKKLLPKIQKNVETWTTGNAIDETEMLKAVIFSNMAEIYENLGDSVQARQNYAFCAREYTTLAEQSKLKNPRGANMEKGFCLLKSGQVQEALSLLGGLASVYPDEFALNYYYAKALQEVGDNQKAYVYAKKALDGGYGDNMIRAATLKAQLELNMKDLANAEKTVNKTLDKIYLPKDMQIRTHRYVNNLKIMLAKIELQKAAKEAK